MNEGVAIFDLDRTLTRRDTYVPFLFGWFIRHPWICCRLAKLLFPACLFMCGKLDNTAMKEACLTAFMAGADRQRANAYAEWFARRIVRTGLRPKARIRIEEHRQRGDRLILASASLDLYVEPLGQLLGFDRVIASRCAYDGKAVGGRLLGKSLRGEYKLQAILAALGNDGAKVIAYSDHASDLPLLRWAGKAVVVNPSSRFAIKAISLGLEIQNWNK